MLTKYINDPLVLGSMNSFWISPIRLDTLLLIISCLRYALVWGVIFPPCLIKARCTTCSLLNLSPNFSSSQSTELCLRTLPSGVTTCPALMTSSTTLPTLSIRLSWLSSRICSASRNVRGPVVALSGSEYRRAFTLDLYSALFLSCARCRALAWSIV